MRRKIFDFIQVAGEYGLWLFANLICFAGFVLVGERWLIETFKVSSDIYGHTVRFFAGYIPVLTLLLICISIYIEHIPRRNPTKAALYAAAPFFAGVALFLLFALISRGALNQEYVDGVSYLALGGALLRVRGFPTKVL